MDDYWKAGLSFGPFILSLCAESAGEQVELLETHKDGIMVAECWDRITSSTRKTHIF